VDAYRAQSYVPLVTVEQLRAAPAEYSDTIRDRYLWLPGSVPERVLRLAGEITRGQTTPYDKAKAIEAYLRRYPYDLDVPAPPPDRDVADYFLFELRKGYCDYYATAMVVLARARGLPARFVSGYAPGDYDAANAQYVIRELHAHSWPEIYFPGIGWIEFEPTASQPEIERAVEEQITEAQPDAGAARLLNRFRLETLLYSLASLAVIPLGLLLYFTWIERWLYLRLAPAAAVEKIYRRLYRLGRPLAGERTRAETAHEFMRKLVSRMNSIRARSRFSTYLSRAGQDVAFLTDMYQSSLFARRTMNRHEVNAALQAWTHLRPRLFVARFSDRLHRMAMRAAKFLGAIRHARRRSRAEWEGS
jgi:hypothetical protein